MARPFSAVTTVAYTVTSTTSEVVVTTVASDEVEIKAKNVNGAGVNVRLANAGIPGTRQTAATLYGGDNMRYEVSRLATAIGLTGTEAITQTVYVSWWR